VVDQLQLKFYCRLLRTSANSIQLKSLGLCTWNKCSAVAEMGHRLATIDMGLSRALSSYQLVSWSIQLCPFRGDGAGSPSNTIWPEPSSTFVPTGILIHLAVWPQKTWAENCGVLCPFLGVSWIPSYTQCRLGRVLYLHAKSQLDPSNPFQNTPASQTGKTDNGPIG